MCVSVNWDKTVVKNHFFENILGWRMHGEDRRWIGEWIERFRRWIGRFATR